MMKNKLYKTLWITMLIIVIGMTTMIVSVRADDTSLLCRSPQDMNVCIGADTFTLEPVDWSYCSRYDFNNDEVINLADVGLFAQRCELNTQKESVEPVIKKSKSSSTVIKHESDGSLTFRGYGTIIQYPNSDMIVKWDKDTVGSYEWDYKGKLYRGIFYDCYGYECVNIKRK